MSARARARLAYVALFLGVGVQAPYLILFYASRGLDLATIGRIAGLAGVVAVTMAPLWGSLSDRFRGSPFVLAAATLLAATGAVGLYVAPGSLVLGLAATGFAAGMSGLSPIVDARALEEAGADRAGYGPLRAWGSASYIVTSVATGLIVDRAGFGPAFALLVGSLIATGAIGLTLRPRPRSAVGSPRAGLSARGLREVFGRRGLGVFVGGSFLTWVGLSAVSSYYSIRLGELHAPVAFVGIAAALGAAVEVPIMLGFPRLVARIGLERLLVVGAAIFIGRAVVASMTTEPAVLVAASGINGIGFALCLVGGVTYVSRRVPPTLAATAQGVFQGLAISFAQVAATTGGGALAGRAGLQAMFLVAAAVGIGGAIVVAAAVRPWAAAGPGGPVTARVDP